MVPALGARAFEDNAVGVVLPEDLALEYLTVLQCQVKHVAFCRVGHRIEHDNSDRSSNRLQAVADASEIAVSMVQPSNAINSQALRHVVHPFSDMMQTVRLATAQRR